LSNEKSVGFILTDPPIQFLFHHLLYRLHVFIALLNCRPNSGMTHWNVPGYLFTRMYLYIFF